MINVVIPMAGLGSRFLKEGFIKPKPFIEVAGRPMIERVMENLHYTNANYFLIGRSNHLYQEADLIKQIISTYQATFIPIETVTEGSACTVLTAQQYFNNNLPLLIANSDQLIDHSIVDFIDDCLHRKLDGSIMTFIDQEKNPKWSFARINDSGIVTEVQEKKPISEYATVGIYLFTRGCDFVDGANDMITANDRVNNEFYTCPVYNYLIKKGKKIGIYNIAFNQMHGLGTPEDLDKFLKNYKGSTYDFI